MRPSAARRSSATQSTSTGLQKSAELYYFQLPYSAAELREATHELIRRNGHALLLHPPARLPRLRRDGPLRQECPDRRDHRRLALGRLPRRGEARARHPRQGLELADDLRRSLIPHAKASGQYLNSILAKTESANAGYDEAILLDERGFVCEGSGENIFVVRDGEICTPGHSSAILDGINRKIGDPDRPRPRLHGSKSATSPAPSSTSPRRSSSPALPPSWSRCARWTTTSWASRARPPRVIQAKFEDALHGRAEEYLEWLDFVDGSESGLTSRVRSVP